MKNGKNKKKRFLVIIPVVIICTFLFACGEEKEPENTGILNIMDFGIRESYGENGILMSSSRGILWLADFSAGEMAPICTIPNCEHKGDTRDNPNPSCDAYIGVYNEWVSMINGTIYYVSNRENFTDYDLIRMDATGKNRKVLCTITDIGRLNHAFCTEDYYFLSFYKEYDETGDYVERPTTGILVVNLKTGEIRKKEYHGEYALCIDTIYAEENTLYFAMSFTTTFYDWNDPDLVFDLDSWIKTFHSKIYRMNLSTMQEEPVLPDEVDELQTLNIGAGYGYLEGEEKAVVNLKTAELISLKDFSGFAHPYCVGEDRFIINTSEDDEHGEIVLYDAKNRKILNRFSYEYGIIIRSACGDSIQVGFGDGKQGYLSLKELLKGNAKIHEFIKSDSFFD